MRSPGTTSPEAGVTMPGGPGHRNLFLALQLPTKQPGQMAGGSAAPNEEVQSGTAALRLVCEWPSSGRRRGGGGGAWGDGSHGTSEVGPVNSMHAVEVSGLRRSETNHHALSRHPFTLRVNHEGTFGPFKHPRPGHALDQFQSWFQGLVLGGVEGRSPSHCTS